MPKKPGGATVWEGRKGARELDRIAEVGDILWVTEDQATNLAPWEDPKLASSYTVTRKSRGGPAMIAAGWSAGDLVRRHGKVWSEQPLGLRDMRGPGPQVAGPFDDQPFDRHLDADEIEHLGKRAKEAAELRRTTTRKGRWL